MLGEGCVNDKAHNLTIVISQKVFICLGKSTSPQNRQVIVYYKKMNYQVDDFVEKLTFYQSLMDTLSEIYSGS